MKRGNLDRAQNIIQTLAHYENIISKTNDKGLLPEVWLGQTKVVIPADHARFLKRVIRDTYQGYINKLQAELEGL